MPLSPSYKKLETQKLISSKPKPIIIDTIKGVDNIQAGYTICIDYETTGLEWWDENTVPLYVAVYSPGNPLYVVDLRKPLVKEAFDWWLAGFLETNFHAVLGHNIKFDMHFTEHYSWDAGVYDTCVGCFMLDENESAGLKESVKRVLGYEMRKFQDVVGTITEEVPTKTKKGTRKKTRTRRLEEVPIEEVADYVSDDVYWTWQLWEKYVKPGLEKDPRLDQNFHQIQMPLLKVLYAMECRGVEIDVSEAKNLLKSYENTLRAIDIQIDQILGENECNLDSPLQLDNLFYNVLHYRRPPFRSARKDDEGKKLRANTRRTSYA